MSQKTYRKPDDFVPSRIGAIVAAKVVQVKDLFAARRIGLPSSRLR
ncbi:hypothetical protein [Roseiconus nitratireducens]|nr:hypothetical protein [Roseiconus nitratireducens]